MGASRGRKPVHLTTKPGRATGRQAVWEAIRKLGAFTMTDISGEGVQNVETIKTYLASLTKAGIIKVTGQKLAPSSFDRHAPELRKSNVYALVKDSGYEAPRVRRDGMPCTQGLPREQMWRTMHEMSSFTPRDLAATASTDTVIVSDIDASSYIKALFKAGYLTRVRKCTYITQASYRLIRHTGPLPPMIQRLKTVFDPNLNRIVWHEEVDA